MKIPKIFTKFRVILLILFVILSLITISPQLFGNEGVSIKSVMQNSSASDAGIENPSSKLTPLAREKIISIGNKKVTNIEEFYEQESLLQLNETVKVETDKRVYTLLAKEGVNGKADLGLKVVTAPTSNLRKGLDLEGGTRVLLKPAEEVSDEDIEIVNANLKERLNVYGLSDVVVRSAADLAGEKFIVVEIAGVTEEEVKDLISKQGKFEAKIGNETVFFGGKKDITYVCRSADCAGIDPSSGCSKRDDNSYFCGFFFAITLSPEAAERQAEITEELDVVDNEYLSQDLTLFLDDVEVDSLKIGKDLQGRATTNIQISGSGDGRTEEEAIVNSLSNMKRLQTIIITGSLPVKLDVVKMDTISPALGKEFLNNILLVAGLVVLVVITVVMIRYRKIKIVGPMIATLLSEIILILGFASLVGWNLDLAAIAGIIIVAGTGVDHLIVITDETLHGEQVSDWKRRIKNAMFIVMGAYLTTVAGMVPLLWAGAGLLKGFALTTIAGISFGVLIARPAYAAIIEYLLK
jgi:preprotein translocase subunit SecD